MIWKAKHGLAPEYTSEMFVPIQSVHDHNTRIAEHGFHPTKKNLNFGLRSYSHYGCQLWNDLPKDVQASTCLSDFKKKLKDFLKRNWNVDKKSRKPLRTREKNLSHGPLEDQTLSERAPCLNKLDLYLFIFIFIQNIGLVL